jgi:hypothetical protein
MEAEPALPIPPARPVRPAPPAAAQVALPTVAPAASPITDADFTFDAAEVDVLVDEVQETPPAWQPQETAPAWQTDMGAPEEEAPEPWAAGGTPALDVLEDLQAPAAEPFDPVESVPVAAPEAWRPPAEEDAYVLDRGFDPAWAAEPVVEACPRAPGTRPRGGGGRAHRRGPGSVPLFRPRPRGGPLSEGTAREIQVPVEMTEGGQRRRFVLSSRSR